MAFDVWLTWLFEVVTVGSHFFEWHHRREQWEAYQVYKKNDALVPQILKIQIELDFSGNNRPFLTSDYRTGKLAYLKNLVNTYKSKDYPATKAKTELNQATITHFCCRYFCYYKHSCRILCMFYWCKLDVEICQAFPKRLYITVINFSSS